MLLCPVCKERKGSYYRAFTQPLSRLLGLNPSIAEAANQWLLLWDKPITSREEFKIRYKYESVGVRWVVPKEYDIPLRFEDGKLVGGIPKGVKRRRYDPYLAFKKAETEQDKILIFLCCECAQKATETLELDRFELERLRADRCRCCGYYTIDVLGGINLCPVCCWLDDNLFALDENSHVTLREARQNYKEIGASDERFRSRVRPPAPEEHPMYFEY